MLWFLGLLLIFVKGGTTNPYSTVHTTYSCPNDFVSVGEKCYHFSKNSAMWSDSHFFCQIMNGSLAVLTSSREHNLLRDFVFNSTDKSIKSSERWIDGIYDWQQRRWKWGASGALITYNIFAKKNVGDEQKWNCIAVNAPKKNRWTSRKCTEKRPFICQTESNVLVTFKLVKKKKFDISKCSSGEKLEKYEKKKCTKLLGYVNPNNPADLTKRQKSKKSIDKIDISWVCPPYMVGLGNRCYYFSTNEATWTNAHFSCRHNKTKLAVIRNKGQDHNLRRFLNNFIEKHDRWIDGIYDWKSDKWRWAMTGQPLKYMGFASQVTRNKTARDFEWGSIFMDPKLDNQWNVDKQTTLKRYICQVKGKAVKKLGSNGLNKVAPSDATIYIVPKQHSTNK